MQSSKEKLVRAISKIVKNHRHKIGKTIYQISAESSLDYSTWRKIETCKYKDIKLTTIWKIAQGLDIYPDNLIKELRLELGSDFNLTDD